MKTVDFQSIHVPERLILLISIFFVFIACNLQAQEGISSGQIINDDPMEGVWELTTYYWVLDDDTLYIDPDNIEPQHKIYLDGYVMWTADPSPDSSEWHGYGTYRFNNGTLIEKLSSMSIPLKTAMGSEDEVLLRIEYDKNTFTQSMKRPHRDTIYQFVEEWRRVNSSF